MTINIADNSARVSYSVADGVTQTSFAVPFEFFDNDDLNVYVDGTLKTITSDYTVSGGDGSTGTVTISVTGASGGSTVVITRDITLERTTDFPVSGAFNIVALNTELDRIVAIAADLDDRASRALQLTDYDVSVGLTLPVVDTRKGKTLAFNATTGAVEAGPSIADTQSVANASADIALLADIQDGTIATNAITNVNTIRTDVTTVSGISGNVTTVATNNANITTVATNDANITTVAGSIANVNTVGNSITNVNTTATNIADVNTVAGEIGVSGVVTIVANAITDVSTVSGDIAAVITAANDLNEAVSEIDTVANSIANVDAVGTNITNVNTVSTAITNVNTVAGDIANVNTVATANTNIGTVATDIANVNTVASQISPTNNISTVAGISTEIAAVAGDATDIGTVATDLAGSNTIGTVAASIANINTVATDITNVNSVATNITGVNSFAERYRVGTSDPTTDLDAGDLFFNTTSNAYKFYDGSGWQVVNVSGIGSVLDDTTPQLGGDLDLNSNNITGTGNINITGIATVDTLSIGGTSVTATATELNYNDITTLGTVEAGKVVTASSPAGNVTFPDGRQAKFGNSGDMSIYHDGSHSQIWELGTGDLKLTGSANVTIHGGITQETMANFAYNGAVTLYYNNVAKLATTSVGADVTGELIADSYNETYGAVISTTNATTVNCEAGNAFSHTLTENTTFTFSNPPTSGTAFSFSIEIIQDASASGFTVTWPASVDWPAATAPTLTATASAKDVFVFYTRDGGTNWLGFTAGQALG